MSRDSLTSGRAPPEGEGPQEGPKRRYREIFGRPTAPVRRLVRWTRWLALALLLPVMLAAAAGQWWLLPRLNEYRETLATALSDYLHTPARIEAVAAEREGWRLNLRLHGVSLRDPETRMMLARFDRAVATLDLWRWLREGRLAFSHIRLEGVSLALEQGADGMLRLRADAGSAETASSLPDLAGWLLTAGQLDLVGDRLTVRRHARDPLQILHPYLQVRDTEHGQRLAFSAEWPTAPGDRLQFSAERSRAAPETWRGAFQMPADRTYPFEWRQSGNSWRGQVRGLRVQDVATWVLPWLDAPARQWLATLAPQGEVPDLVVEIAAAHAYVATARFHKLAFQPAPGLPGCDAVSGTVELRPGQGTVELEGHAVRVDTDGLLRAPVTLEVLSGQIAWRRIGEDVHLESTGLDIANADLKAHLWGRVTVPAHGTPFLDVQGRYHDVKIGAARRYLPAAVIPPDGMAWLDQALVSGRVVTGEGRVRGPAAAFPFDRGEGRFETRFQIEDAVLDYAPGWPLLSIARGTVRFRNRQLHVEVSAGRLLDAEVEDLTAEIDDLEAVVVQVKGRARAPGASLWRAFNTSPVGRELGVDFPKVQIGGATTLDLELTIPTDARPIQARGRVGLLDNRLTLPDGNVALERLRGELRFTEASLDAKGVQAQWRGQPIRLALDLIGRTGRRELRTRLRGQLELAALVGETTARALGRTVSGKSRWEAVATLPIHRREPGDPTPPFTLELSSNLRGTTVQWPEPLGKTAREARPLNIRLRPRAGDALELMLDYGANGRAALEIVDFSHHPRLTRGELRFNAGAATLPEKPGLVIVADLPRWKLAAQALSPSNPLLENETTTGAAFWGDVRRVDARIGELIVGQESFVGVTLHAAREDKTLRVDLTGETLVGRITVPDQPTAERPVNAALQRLHLRSAPESTSSHSEAADARFLDPRRWPPLVVTATDLRWNGAELGRLRLVAMPRPGGMRLAELTLESERQRLDATGDWWWTPDGSTSQLRATLYSPALGEALAVLSYDGSGIARGETEADLAVEWAGAPPEFALERLKGTLRLRVGPGQLLAVNPGGLGRMVGLFSVQNLLRRLALDFSDLVQPGTSFDQITGTLTFQRGQLYTDDLTIEAPAARIQIEGRTRLEARDYDQRITIIPRLGGALSVAGALAGGPAVGVALLLAEPLLQKGIEQATPYRYALTGSWDRPVIALLQASPPVTAARGLGGDR